MRIAFFSSSPSLSLFVFLLPSLLLVSFSYVSSSSGVEGGGQIGPARTGPGPVYKLEGVPNTTRIVCHPFRTERERKMRRERKKRERKRSRLEVFLKYHFFVVSILKAPTARHSPRTHSRIMCAERVVRVNDSPCYLSGGWRRNVRGGQGELVLLGLVLPPPSSDCPCTHSLTHSHLLTTFVPPSRKFESDLLDSLAIVFPLLFIARRAQNHHQWTHHRQLDWSRHPTGVRRCVADLTPRSIWSDPLSAFSLRVVVIMKRIDYVYLGSLYPNEESEFCRARILADAEGRFGFETNFPGSYGLYTPLSPLFSLWPNSPPYRTTPLYPPYLYHQLFYSIMH